LQRSTRRSSELANLTVVFECDAAEYNGPRGNAWRHFAGEHGYRMNAFESGENSSGLMQCIIERIAPR
jgi:hypothetical protein